MHGLEKSLMVAMNGDWLQAYMKGNSTGRLPQHFNSVCSVVLFVVVCKSVPDLKWSPPKGFPLPLGSPVGSRLLGQA